MTTMNETTTMNVTISNETMNKLHELLATRPNQTIEQLIQSCFDRGVEDRVYRTKRNREQYNEFKMFRAMKNGR